MPNLIEDGEKYGYSKEEWLALGKSKRSLIRHPEKHKAAQQKWRDANKEYNVGRQRPYHLKYRYGIEQRDYEKLLADQHGACAICKTQTPTGKWKVFAVDHCHTTGEIRGLLCNECNRGMGLLKDNSNLLRAAAEYLECHKKKTASEKVTRNENR